MPWQCPSCEYDENEDAAPRCESCDEQLAAAAPAPAGAGAPLIVVARVTAVEPIPNKDKLRKVTLDAGGAAEVVVVTNSAVHLHTLVCVALPGATVRVGGEEVQVKAAAVGGVASGGMLCDSAMVGWKGGAAGLAATVPEAAGMQPGQAVPAARPRGDA